MGNSKKNKNNKTRKTLKIMGYVICTILLIATIVTSVFAIKLNVLPTPLLVILILIGLVVIGIFAMCQRWLVPGVITKVLAFAMTLVMVLACVYMNITFSALSKMTGVSTQISNIHVYVLAEDPADDLADISDYQFGILGTLDRDNTDKFVRDINSDLKKEISITEYNNVIEIADALYSGEVRAIILNSAYISFVTDTAGYEDFESRIKSISSVEIVEEIEVNEEKKDIEYSGDEVVAIYISGNDCEGVPEVNGNSDVNILLVANLKTRQVLLVSTPRDFYVPLSISNGQKDKLTHAGAYGIDVSVETLEMLYGLDIDDYVKVNFTGFIEIVDALGGVTVYSEYDFYMENDTLHYTQGYNELNGYEALMFARNRGAFSDGDRQRGKNQMAVIEAIIKEMATSDMLKNYTEVLDAISDSMITSMSYEEISNLVKFQLNNMEPWEVLKYSVNGYDSANVTYSLGGTVYVMEPDYATVEQAKEYIRQMYEGKRITIQP
ncbi:MAG: LCP family protein [Lachnospiraceae bacterium]|nr:LCP family protein [Lachnospiraceae bacterium]